MARSYSDEDRAFLLTWVPAWSEAVDLQAQRVAAAGVVLQGVDSDLFLHFIRNLRRACAVFEDDHRVVAALATFDAAAGPITEARDLLEHFDEYDRGTGHLQRSGVMRDPELLLFYGATPGDRQIHIGPHVISVSEATAAARDLADTVIAIGRRS